MLADALRASKKSDGSASDIARSSSAHDRRLPAYACIFGIVRVQGRLCSEFSTGRQGQEGRCDSYKRTKKIRGNDQQKRYLESFEPRKQ
jgi:hypothetical protein